MKKEEKKEDLFTNDTFVVEGSLEDIFDLLFNGFDAFDDEEEDDEEDEDEGEDNEPIESIKSKKEPEKQPKDSCLCSLEAKIDELQKSINTLNSRQLVLTNALRKYISSMK